MPSGPASAGARSGLISRFRQSGEMRTKPLCWVKRVRVPPLALVTQQPTLDRKEDLVRNWGIGLLVIGGVIAFFVSLLGGALLMIPGAILLLGDSTKKSLASEDAQREVDN